MIRKRVVRFFGVLAAFVLVIAVTHMTYFDSALYAPISGAATAGSPSFYLTPFNAILLVIVLITFVVIAWIVSHKKPSHRRRHFIPIKIR